MKIIGLCEPLGPGTVDAQFSVKNSDSLLGGV